MPSPFPGMDPYLEGLAEWPGFRVSFLVALRAELNQILPEGYAASLDEYRSESWYYPRNRCLNVHEARRGPTRTIIEMISPLQKIEGTERSQYFERRKRHLLRHRCDLVEIDLTRSEQRLIPQRGELPPHDYLIAKISAADPGQVAIWPLTVRQSLPTIGIPIRELLPGTPVTLRCLDVAVALQRCFDKSYDDGSYHRFLNYDAPPAPPLSEQDRTWAHDLLAKRKPSKD